MAADAQLIGSVGSSTAASVISGAGNSTGLTKFLMCLRVFPNSSFDSIAGTVTDSQGNTYNQVGSTEYSPGGDDALAMFLCESGTGSASHTATMTYGITPFSSSATLIGITGAAATALDVTNGANGSYASNNPIGTTTGALAQANEVIVAVAIWDTGGGGNPWGSGTMVVLEQDPGGNPTPVSGAVGKLVVTSASSAAIDLIPDVGGASAHQGAILFATFKAAGGGATSTFPLPKQIYVMP